MAQQKTPKLFKNFRGLLAFNPFLSYNLGDHFKDNDWRWILNVSDS